MGRECRERIPRHRFQMKRLVSDPGMHQGTCVTHVPWCMSGIADLKWWGKRLRHSRRMCNLQFCAAGKRPIEKAGTIVLCCTRFHWQPCLSIFVGDFYTLLHCTVLYIWSTTRKSLVTVWSLFHNQHLSPFMSKCRCQRLYDASHKTY